MTTLSSLRSGIKSIQSGTITLGPGAPNATATISSVNTAKAFVIHNGQSTTSDLNSAQVHTRAVLTNATTVTASRGGTSSTVLVSYVVVEFY